MSKLNKLAVIGFIILGICFQVVAGCKSLELVQKAKDDPATRQRIINMPEVQALIAAQGISSFKVDEMFCDQDPGVRIIIRLEAEDILREEAGITLPRKCD